MVLVIFDFENRSQYLIHYGDSLFYMIIYVDKLK